MRLFTLNLLLLLSAISYCQQEVDFSVQKKPAPHSPSYKSYYYKELYSYRLKDGLKQNDTINYTRIDLINDTMHLRFKWCYLRDTVRNEYVLDTPVCFQKFDYINYNVSFSIIFTKRNDTVFAYSTLYPKAQYELPFFAIKPNKVISKGFALMSHLHEWNPYIHRTCVCSGTHTIELNKKQFACYKVEGISGYNVLNKKNKITSRGEDRTTYFIDMATLLPVKVIQKLYFHKPGKQPKQPDRQSLIFLANESN